MQARGLLRQWITSSSNSADDVSKYIKIQNDDGIYNNTNPSTDSLGNSINTSKYDSSQKDLRLNPLLPVTTSNLKDLLGIFKENQVYRIYLFHITES